jgi:hypothetical protein
MNLFGESSDDYIDDANDSIKQGYNEAAGYEEPYTQYGSQDFDSARKYLYKSLGGRQNYNQNFLNYLNMSPSEMLNQALSGYTESPEAQTQSAYALDASNNAMIAEGMGASGTNQAADAEIQNAIIGQDQQQYLGNLMGALGIQGKTLSGYDKQTQSLMKMFQSMLGTEEDASGDMADNAMKAAQYSANADERGAMSADQRQRTTGRQLSQGLNDAASLAAMAVFI